MDYIEYAIEFLDKNNHGISAGRARDQYIALKARIAQLEAAEQSVYPTGGNCAECGELQVVYDGCCINCGTPATSG